MSKMETLQNTYDSRDGGMTAEDARTCELILAQWMSALNSHDARAMEKLMRFPHARLAANDLVIYQKPGDNPMDLFSRLADSQGWHHSAWTEIKLLQSSPIKAHYAVQYTRYREDDTIIGVFDSLYVFTAVDGDWKLQLRSSFGP